MPIDIDAAEDWLEQWTADAGAHAEQVAELARRVAALIGSAESPDGLIGVVVGSSGRIESLHLDEQVRQWGGAELSGRIMSVLRAAQSDLAAQVAAQVDDTVGADTETGRAVLRSFEARFPAGETEYDDRAATRARFRP